MNGYDYELNEWFLQPDCPAETTKIHLPKKQDPLLTFSSSFEDLKSSRVPQFEKLQKKPKSDLWINLARFHPLRGKMSSKWIEVYEGQLIRTKNSIFSLDLMNVKTLY
jgi:hypothetical protein